jgi:beta-galactosidase GanA
MKKSEQNAALAAVEAKGARTLRSGLGLAPGNYTFKTPDSEDIFHIKEVRSGKGEDWAITLVAGTVSNDKGFSKTFGLGDKDAQMGVTVDQWQGIDPNQVYDMVINEKGRVQSLLLASNDEIVSSSEVIKGSTKSKNKVVA